MHRLPFTRSIPFLNLESSPACSSPRLSNPRVRPILSCPPERLELRPARWQCRPPRSPRRGLETKTRRRRLRSGPRCVGLSGRGTKPPRVRCDLDARDGPGTDFISSPSDEQALAGIAIDASRTLEPDSMDEDDAMLLDEDSDAGMGHSGNGGGAQSDLQSDWSAAPRMHHQREPRRCPHPHLSRRSPPPAQSRSDHTTLRPSRH